jgi:hypothetical protein
VHSVEIEKERDAMKKKSSTLAALGLVAGSLVSGGSLSLLGTSVPVFAATISSCASSRIALRAGTAQGTAGTTYIPLIFTNMGPSCALWGVPVVQPVAGASRHHLGPQARNDSVGEMAVRHVVAKGHSVSVAFGVVETGNFTASTCVARNAAGVIVSLGRFVHATFVQLPITVCTMRASTTTRLIVPGINGD